MSYKTIDQEILETIKNNKKKLDSQYQEFSIKFEKFCNEFQSIQSLNEAEDIINWLKEYVIATKILEDYINNFPNVKNPLKFHFTDKIEKINNLDSVSNEVIKTILPLALLYQQILYIKET